MNDWVTKSVIIDVYKGPTVKILAFVLFDSLSTLKFYIYETV